MRNPSNVSKELDKKYGMKRPTFKTSDLEILRERYAMEKQENSLWQDSWVKEETLIRFLKANVTVEESIKALATYCDWRIKYHVDDISPDDENLQKEKALKRERVIKDVKDFCERQIVQIYPCFHDKNHGDYPSLYKYIILKIEEVCKMCDESGLDGTFCLIIDMREFSMSNMDYSAVRKILWILKNCYPERLGVCLIINYPWLFYGCWELIKLWLNDVTKSKIHFCTKNEIKDFLDPNMCNIEINA